MTLSDLVDIRKLAYRRADGINAPRGTIHLRVAALLAYVARLRTPADQAPEDSQ